ncbi:unnamed protein product [Calypogeia fissa]
MSQREEEEEATSPGYLAAAAPGDQIDIKPEASSPSEAPDGERSLSNKSINVFSSSDVSTTHNVAEGLTDSQEAVDDHFVENGGRQEDFDSRFGVGPSSSKGETGGDFDSGIGESSGGKDEAAMAEALINGLHHVEHGRLVGPTEGNDQQKIGTSDQHLEVGTHQPSDRGAERVSTPHMGNGSEGQRPGGAIEHHRRPPLSGSQSGRPSDGPEGYPGRPAGGKNLFGDVLYSISAEDEEGRSRQRILAFAAKRYATAVERNPDDHDALYNWALVLQESADNTGPEAGNSAKDSLLEEACRKYEAATKLCPTLHEAFYNWAIAISDRAKIRGRTKEAEELWKQACERYDKSVQLNWNSPQALNNWGLALQELGAIVPLKEKRAIVKLAITKFRLAIRLRFDFHRAVYNLGTVLYGLAEDTVRAGRKLSTREPTPSELYSQSAIYIAAAHALKPDYPVYRSALRLVRPMLPLPFVKAGYLTIPPVGDSLAPHSDWQRLWFVLNHEALFEMEKFDRKSVPISPSRRLSAIGESSSSSFRQPIIRIEMEDIVFMTSTADLSLPSGGGFRIDTTTGHHFLIADTWEAMDGWVDAIRLVYTIFARGKRDSLAGVLAG